MFECGVAINMLNENCATSVPERNTAAFCGRLDLPLNHETIPPEVPCLSVVHPFLMISAFVPQITKHETKL